MNSSESEHATEAGSDRPREGASSGFPARANGRGSSFATLVAAIVLGAVGMIAIEGPDGPIPQFGQGLRAFWRLGETTGTNAADQVDFTSAAYSGSPELGGDGAIGGDPDTSVRFDGLDDQVKVDDSAVLSPTEEVSLEAWVRLASLPEMTATLLRKDGQYLLRVTDQGALTFRLWSDGDYTGLSTPPGSLTARSWHQVVATYDGSEMRIYVDGVETASRPFSGALDVTGSSLYLGSSGGYDWLEGSLDEVAVYGGALERPGVFARFRRASLVDPTQPKLVLSSPATGSTMDARPNFGGIAGSDPGDTERVTVKVYSGGEPSGAVRETLRTIRSPVGAFSVLAEGPLASGTYTARAQQQDSSGNLGFSEPRTFTVEAGADPRLLAAGDIAYCGSGGDEATARLLDGLGGTVTPIGDTVYEYGTTAEFTNCYDPTWGRQLARSRPIVGDHEFGTPGARPYFAYFGAAAGPPGTNRGYYSYEIGDWHVIALNSYCYEIETCVAGTEGWLTRDLARNDSACTVALYHEPLFSSGKVHGNNPGSRYLWELMYEAGVDVVLSGSEHIYERFAPQTPFGKADPDRGIREFIVGTGGRSHYPIGKVQPNSEVRNASTFGVLEMTLRPDRYDWRFHPVAGRSFTDAGTTRCH